MALIAGGIYNGELIAGGVFVPATLGSVTILVYNCNQVAR